MCGGTRDRLSIRMAPLDGLSCLYASVVAGKGKEGEGRSPKTHFDCYIFSDQLDREERLEKCRSVSAGMGCITVYRIPAHPPPCA